MTSKNSENLETMRKASEMVSEASKKIVVARKWYLRRRYWFWTFFCVAVWFCLVPSCQKRITEESHRYTEPAMRNGYECDYLARYNAVQNETLRNPDENGFRLVLAALGPVTLEQLALAERTPWKDIPTKQAQWWNHNWLPLCEKLKIDPLPEPEFIHYRPIELYMILHGIKGNEPILPEERKRWDNYREVPVRLKFDQATEAARIIQSRPWKEQDYPIAAQWLKKYDPLLDLACKAARMPVYASFHYPIVQTKTGEPVHSISGIMLPDVQAQRETARALACRANYRIGRKEYDKAIDDIEGIMHLARHLQTGPSFIVEVFVGLAMANIAFHCTKNLLDAEDVTREQYARIESELDRLPDSLPGTILGDTRRRELACLSLLDHCQCEVNHPGLMDDLFDTAMLPPRPLPWRILPIDRNIAMRQAKKRCDEYFEPIWNADRPSREKAVAAFEKAYKEYTEALWRRWYDYLLVGTRSRLYGDWLFAEFARLNRLGSTIHTLSAGDARRELMRATLALARYRADHGDYPARLEELVPQYAKAVPFDPFADKPLRYEKEGARYRLWSVGINRTDDGNKRQPRSDDITFDDPLM